MADGYEIKKYKDGSIAIVVKGDGQFIPLPKQKIKELIQDLLKCLKSEPSIAGEKDKG